MGTKLGAYQAVQKAIRRGDLSRVSECDCVHCGKKATEYHHYKGYSRRHYLTVKPLCKPCHGKEHNRDGSSLGDLKLSDNDVRVARRMRREGIKVKHIARFFGMGYAFMGKILNRKAYKWVD